MEKTLEKIEQIVYWQRLIMILIFIWVGFIMFHCSFIGSDVQQIRTLLEQSVAVGVKENNNE